MSQLCLPELNALLKAIHRNHAVNMLELFSIVNQGAQGDRKTSKPLLDSLRKEAGIRSSPGTPGKAPGGLSQALGMKQR